MSDMAQVLPQARRKKRESSIKMGEMLIHNGKLQDTDIETVLQTQQMRGLRFGEAAVSLGLVNKDDVRSVLYKQFSFQQVETLTNVFDPSLITAYHPEGVTAEAFRGLRSELLLRYFEPNPHSCLALVGAQDHRHNAWVCANLAYIFSQMGKQTLLIDANLRQPQIHRFLGLQSSHGLSDLLAMRSLPDPENAGNNFWVLNAGTQAPNPQELLASKSFKNLLNTMSRRFDLTLINTPPMAESQDAQLISAHAGAALLVARKDITKLRDMTMVVNKLRGVGVRLVGSTLVQ